MGGAGGKLGNGMAITRRLGAQRVKLIVTASSERINDRIAKLRVAGFKVEGRSVDLTQELTVSAIVRAQWPAFENASFFGCHHLSRYLNKTLELQRIPKCFTAQDEVTPLELLKVLRSATQPADISILTAATATPMVRALCGLDAS